MHMASERDIVIGQGYWKEQGEVGIDAKALATGGDAKAQLWDDVGKRSRSRWF